MNRVLKPGGKLYISDPITTAPIPEKLRNDERLRAMCLSGALFYEEYIQKLPKLVLASLKFALVVPIEF